MEKRVTSPCFPFFPGTATIGKGIGCRAFLCVPLRLLEAQREAVTRFLTGKGQLAAEFVEV
jgi:hypothetical protein